MCSQFQSTLPREERPRQVRSFYDLFLFQSTLPREERLRPDAPYRESWQNFNPRSHERSDFFASALVQLSSNFNPRSHERSDKTEGYMMIKLSEFQSTLPREERLIFLHLCDYTCIFQSTLPREERLKFTVYFLIFQNFNPRSHERSDEASFLFHFSLLSISIHAPTRGATYTRL